jgi:hypothetical protein
VWKSIAFRQGSIRSNLRFSLPSRRRRIG